MRYCLLIAYDGGAYCGWQIQPHGRSVQQQLEAVLQQILQSPVKVIGSGRTDSGVHALGQVAHFDSPQIADEICLLRSLNALLPDDVHVLQCTRAPDGFHARFGAKRKIYHYLVDLRPTHDPLRWGHIYHHPRPLNIEAMRLAAMEFVGERDFASVANVGSGARTTIRQLHRLELVEESGLLRLEFEGNGFLYKMVRNIVGLLLEVGRGRATATDCREILAARDRRRAGRPAPACGLYLMAVSYEASCAARARLPARATPATSRLAACKANLPNPGILRGGTVSPVTGST